MVRIFLHSDCIQRDTALLSVISLNAVIYRPEQNHFEYGHFLRSDVCPSKTTLCSHITIVYIIIIIIIIVIINIIINIKQT